MLHDYRTSLRQIRSSSMQWMVLCCDPDHFTQHATTFRIFLNKFHQLHDSETLIVNSIERRHAELSM